MSLVSALLCCHSSDQDSRKKHALVIIIINLFLHEVFHHKNTVKSIFAKQYNGAPFICRFFACVSEWPWAFVLVQIGVTVERGVRPLQIAFDRHIVQLIKPVVCTALPSICIHLNNWYFFSLSSKLSTLRR